MLLAGALLPGMAIQGPALNNEQPAAGKGRRRYLSAAERKPEILEAALTVFSRHGYVATRMEAIASEAGLSKAGLYAHYASKEEIFEELLVNMLSPAEPLQIVFEGEPTLEAIIDAYLQSRYQITRQPRMLAAFRLLMLESQRAPLALIRRWHQRVVEISVADDLAIFRQCAERGIMRSSALLESRVLASSPLVSWLCMHMVFGEDTPVSLEQVYQDHRRMLIEILSPAR